ncbi:MAG: hypothetical protein R2713_22630 [Ilumatobacteraceae bacterium]
MLIPSLFVPGMDPVWTLATALALSLTTIGLLSAVRVGEFDPPMSARAAKNLVAAPRRPADRQHHPSELAGETLGSVERYRRTAEAMRLLRSPGTTSRSPTTASTGGTTAFDDPDAHPHATADVLRGAPPSRPARWRRSTPDGI